MFRKLMQWIVSLFRRDADSLDFFKVNERLIYRYFNGKEEVFVDPMVLQRKMMDASVYLSNDIKVAESPSKDAPKARIKVIEHIRSIFSIKPYEEGGLTELECADLLNHFLTFCGWIKKNLNPTPTSQEVISATTETLSGDVRPTASSSGSGSIDEGKNIENPPSSPSPSVSPAEASNQPTITTKL